MGKITFKQARENALRIMYEAEQRRKEVVEYESEDLILKDGEFTNFAGNTDNSFFIRTKNDYC